VKRIFLTCGGLIRGSLICGAAVLALGACAKKTETAATGTAAPAPANAPAATPVGPIGLPSRKAGLWEQTMNSEKMHQTVSMCIDTALDQKMKVWGSQSGKSNCSEEKISQHLGGGYEFHAVCAMGESGTITSDGQATGDFGSHYTVALTSTTSGSPMAQANGVHKMSIDAVWKGPCPADMKPGDMMLPGGMKFNVADAMAGAAAGGRPSPEQMAKMRAQAMEMKKQMEAAKQ
jgi:hypothetical protein